MEISDFIQLFIHGLLKHIMEHPLSFTLVFFNDFFIK
jgi:hypothetical protein